MSWIRRRQRRHTAEVPPDLPVVASDLVAQLPGPAAPPGGPTGAPVGYWVAVVGPPGRLLGLGAALPETWTLEHVEEVGDLTVADLVVLVQPSAGKVASALARQPDAAVLALTHPTARADDVVELLQAGATACVRSGDPQLVAAHLLACARRYPIAAA